MFEHCIEEFGEVIFYCLVVIFVNFIEEDEEVIIYSLGIIFEDFIEQDESKSWNIANILKSIIHISLI